MGLFDFDSNYTLFGSTPVDNQFLVELMPGAKGDYVKVYLYGLMHCYHPGPDLNLENMSHELGLELEDILTAFRYWERRGVVRRISDNPPSWQFINRFERKEMAVDEGYVSFVEALQAQLPDRKLTSRELAMAYDWVEGVGLPAEVVLMLVNHQTTTRGKHFSFRAAEKIAVQMRDEGIVTPEDADEFFSRDKDLYDSCRIILRRLGKRREPSKDELALYTTWTKEYGFSYEAIEEACRETTKGEPTMAYLDGILRGMKTRHGDKALSLSGMKDARDEEKAARAPLKKLLATMKNGTTVNEASMAIYREMAALYPEDVILLAGRECAARPGAVLEDVVQLLESWQARGLKDAEAVQAYIRSFNAQNKFLRDLYSIWGIMKQPDAKDRASLEKWHKEMGFPRDSLLTAAEFSKGKTNPMAYMNKLLADFHGKGLKKPEEIAAAFAAEKKKSASGSGTPAAGPAPKRDQSYTNQRDYTNVTANLDHMAALLKEVEEDAKRDPQ